MRQLLLGGAGVVAVTAACVLALAGGSADAQPSPRASHPLDTAVLDPENFAGDDRKVAFQHARAGGARVARLILLWPSVAPAEDRPVGFDPKNPRDPLYRFEAFDEQLRAAVSSGLQPIVDIVGAPSWAQGGTSSRPGDGPVRPSPAALADFATAAARRYGGGFQGLPRVRYWQVWNEPNLSQFLMPQSVNGRAVSPEWYRAMVNAMAAAVHAVRRDNVVVAGGLAPYGGDRDDPSRPNRDLDRTHPQQFMRQMLCMSRGANPRPTCKQGAELDVWAHHPYAYGGPTYEAFHPDDVSIGDLDEMRTLLDAAKRARHIDTRQRDVVFWVTEFSYDSSPPDPKGVPTALHTRWVAESLYRMWGSGVSLVTWFLVRDMEWPDGLFQSGLYFRGENGIESDRPKPALRAFRFPFVAFREPGGTISYWGRTPASVRKSVVVEQKSGGSWRRVAVSPVDGFGIFMGKIEKRRGLGHLRARMADRSDVSVPFGLKVPKDRRICPFGTGC